MNNFAEISERIGRLVEEKNRAYGDSAGCTGAILRILYPDGIEPEHYDKALLLVRMLDKVKRIATDVGAFGEQPWEDIAGYGILGVEQSERRLRKELRKGPHDL